jgi:prepilin-type N-terminal cleavage/methylation domain-containing protein
VEEDLMRTHPASSNPRQGQAGFSMIEMLMTAFILAIGILGLTMLQVMSLKASRGGRSLSTAVLVGERVMDQVEMEGRLSWLNATGQYTGTSNAVDLPNLRYVSLAPGVAGALTETFNSKGGPPLGNPDPADNSIYFIVVTTKNVSVAPGAAPNGALSNFTVTVAFTDQLTQGGAAIPRTVVLTRRILHA